MRDLRRDTVVADSGRLEVFSEWSTAQWFEQGLGALEEYLAKCAEFVRRFPNDNDPED